jgi:hypothetical protein
LGVGRGANSPTQEKFTVTKPPELMEEAHGRGQDPHRVEAPVKTILKASKYVYNLHKALMLNDRSGNITNFQGYGSEISGNVELQ